MKKTIIISLLLLLCGSMPLMAQNSQSGVSTDNFLIFFSIAIVGLFPTILIEKVRGMYEFWYFGLVNWYFIGIIIFFLVLLSNQYSFWLICPGIIVIIALWITWYRYSKRCKKCKKWGSMKIFKKELVERRDSTVKENDTYLPATTYISHIHRRCSVCGHEDYLRSKKKEKN